MNYAVGLSSLAVTYENISTTITGLASDGTASAQSGVASIISGSTVTHLMNLVGAALDITDAHWVAGNVSGVGFYMDPSGAITWLPSLIGLIALDPLTNAPEIGESASGTFMGYLGNDSWADLGIAGSLLSAIPTWSLLFDEDSGNTFLWAAILGNTPKDVCGYFTCQPGEIPLKLGYNSSGMYLVESGSQVEQFRPWSSFEGGSPFGGDTSVPEPASCLLIATGLLALRAIGRRISA